MLIPHLILVTLCLSFLSTSLGYYGKHYKATNCTTNLHDYDAVQTSVKKAQSLMNNDESNVPVEKRLLIMMLFSTGFAHNDVPRLNYLKCSLNKLKAQMMPTTTVDIFIWVRNIPGIPNIYPEWLKNFPRTHIMEIEPSSWRLPCDLKNETEWVMWSDFSIDYYLMGRWRLTFAFDFAKAMGYPYLMQLDDDAVLNSHVEKNIVEVMNMNKYQMAVFHDSQDEIREVIWGLPEFTRYWLTINNFTPVGPLFKHLTPPNLNGLTMEGWDRHYYRGYAIITSLEYWFQPNAQDFVTRVMRLGRDIEGRWQEQAVMNMMRLLFIPEDKLIRFNAVEFGHNREDGRNFHNWCTRQGYT